MILLDALRSALFGVFRYSGRADRLEQWAFSFLTALLVLGVMIATRNGLEIRGNVLLTILFVGIWFFLAHFSLFVRRLHDHDRSGFFMAIPLFGASLMLVGYLGERGYVTIFEDIMRDYGWWIRRGGQAVLTISGSMLIAVFSAPGTPRENRYGDPLE